MWLREAQLPTLIRDNQQSCVTTMPPPLGFPFLVSHSFLVSFSSFSFFFFFFSLLDTTMSIIFDKDFSNIHIKNKTNSFRPFIFRKKMLLWGTWLSQSVKCPSLHFGSCHHLRVVRRSPTLSSALGMESV